MESLKAEIEPFLTPESDRNDASTISVINETKYRKWRWSLAIITHATTVILTLCAVTLLTACGFAPGIKLSNTAHSPSLFTPFTPFREYIIHEPDSELWHKDIYFGTPNDESEQAWNDILHPHGLALFPNEAKKMGIEHTLKLANGNYYTIPHVYHSMHCIRVFRQKLHASHYYPNATKELLAYQAEHERHCLEVIFDSLMCQPDLNPGRYYWSDGQWQELSVAPDVKRECVNWEKLHSFKKSRGVDRRDIMHHGVRHGKLHPEFDPD